MEEGLNATADADDIVPDTAPADDMAADTAPASATESEPPAPKPKKESWLFRSMTTRPWPYMLILPTILIVLAAVGWTQDDYVEKEVKNIWISQDGSYYSDTQYAGEFGKDSIGYTAFLAMSISRDGNNLFTEPRLNEIRDRMESMENTTIQYKGVEYHWSDLCASSSIGLNTAYKFICARLSPMDFFQEARWFFDEQGRVTWYTEVVQELLVKPRIPRFGILQGICSSAGGPTSQSDACDNTLALRTSPEYAVANGYPADYANPLSLFSDIGNMEFNDPCRICIEQAFETTMSVLTPGINGTFRVLAFELNRLLLIKQADNATTPEELQQLGGLLQQVGTIVQGGMITRTSVEEFYKYYVTRSLYGQLGADSYQQNYAGFMEGFQQLCLALNQGDTTKCPATVTEPEAVAALLVHADNTFSAVTTAGNPFPFWSNGNGTGVLFGGTSPVGGSGVPMAGQLLSTSAYLDAANFDPTNPVPGGTWNPLYSNGATVDPLTPGQNWQALVETDPVYRWFLAAVTPMTSSCGNGDLTGTATGDPQVDGQTAAVASSISQDWCTVYSVPFEEAGDYTQQHFAKMWYDLLIDSPQFLGLVQGKADPYVWTTGQGCGYDLKGSRFSYLNKSEDEVLLGASRELYYIDEGESVGAVDTNLLLGGVDPPVGEYNQSNQLTTVAVTQSIYPTLLPEDIVNRVKNCNRPEDWGGPQEISEEDAVIILENFKEAFEDRWTVDWDDDDAGDVQFVGFYDDSGVIGTTGRLLNDITLDNGTLTAISIVLIAAFSALFMFDTDFVESRVLITLVGVSLVVLSFFGALGLAILCGIKININIAWTLPFVILGLGVDDMYIVLLSVKKQRAYTREAFIQAMKEVVVPVTMTSLVNASMFAILNIIDIPAVHKTAQAACISVVFLYLTVIFSFPAYCYLDMQRQLKGRYDVCLCKKRAEEENFTSTEMHAMQDHGLNVLVYERIYKPLMLSSGRWNRLVHLFVWITAACLLGFGIWGITEREVGLGLEDFFPKDHQAGTWATVRTEELASWSVGMNWGALNYTDPDTQMHMIKQFEDVVGTPNIADTDTKQLWMADFLIWTTRHCSANFDREDADVKECGRDQEFAEGSTCTGKWVPNTLPLREKVFQDPTDVETCLPREGGICRPQSQMHPLDLLDAGVDPSNSGDASYCPVFEGWSDDKLAFCIRKWREFTGGGGDFVVEENSATENDQCPGEFIKDDVIVTPIPMTKGPSLYAFGMNSHDATLDMIKATRNICDDDTDYQCWMNGIPYDYWEQYLWVEDVLLEASGLAIACGFGVSWLFLFGKIKYEGIHPTRKIFMGSLLGALLIAIMCIVSLVAVVGLSVFAGVSLTAFSDLSFVLSVGFSVEYSVHVIHRFMKAPNRIDEPIGRVRHAMSFLTLPTFMAFTSSMIGVACLAFTDFEFNDVFFFRPLIILMPVTYFYGCWFLPSLLLILKFDCLKLGKVGRSMDSETKSRFFSTTKNAAAVGVPADEGLVEEAPPADEEALSAEKDAPPVENEDLENAMDKNEPEFET